MTRIDEAQAAQMAAAARLQPWILKGFEAEYVAAQWPGSNESGLIPFGPNVLIKMDHVADQTRGGILMIDDRKDRMNEAAVTGVVFEVGTLAFHGDPSAPAPGDRVYIDKYAGIKAVGMDGEVYRLVDEKQIAGKVTDEFKALIEGVQ